MVSTRRSTQRQPSTEAPQGSGPNRSSQQGQSAAGRGRGRPAAGGHDVTLKQQPGAIEEEAVHDFEGNEAGAGEPRELPSSQFRIGGAQAVAVSSGDDDLGPSARQSVPKATTVPATASDSGEDSDGDDASDDSASDDDDDDDAIFRPNMLEQLATSLRTALHARAGTREASPSPQLQPERAGPSDEKLGLSCDPKAIRWQPEVKQVEMVSGPQRVAPGTGATKESGLAKQLLAPPRVKEDNGALTSDAKSWFKLPATKITDEVKQELRLLRLRGAYDPKRFYKSFDETKFPKHFQIGTVLDNPQDYYSSRLTNRERGVSITQELLSDPAVTAVRKKRYAKLQQEATRFQNVKKRKTDLKRDKAKPKRPKH